MVSTSPTWAGRLGLVRWPWLRTRPAVMACRARERVLKKRAAHSHLSRRTGWDCSVMAGFHQFEQGGQQFVEDHHPRQIGVGGPGWVAMVGLAHVQLVAAAVLPSGRRHRSEEH